MSKICICFVTLAGLKRATNTNKSRPNQIKKTRYKTVVTSWTRCHSRELWVMDAMMLRRSGMYEQHAHKHSIYCDTSFIAARSSKQMCRVVTFDLEVID